MEYSLMLILVVRRFHLEALGKSFNQFVRTTIPLLSSVYASRSEKIAFSLVHGSDPDILSDFILPSGHNPNTTDGSFFTFSGFRTIFQSEFPSTFTVTQATLAEYPAKNGQSVSFAVLQYPSGTVNPPHSHPRAAELLFVVYGSLEVGFVDSTNKLFTQTLELGDVFVFPKGLVHYQYNADPKEPAVAVSAFGSAAAGLVSVPVSVFATGIDETILATSFKTDVATIEKIKAGLVTI